MFTVAPLLLSPACLWHLVNTRIVQMENVTYARVLQHNQQYCCTSLAKPPIPTTPHAACIQSTSNSSRLQLFRSPHLRAVRGNKVRPHRSTEFEREPRPRPVLRLLEFDLLGVADQPRSADGDLLTFGCSDMKFSTSS